MTDISEVADGIYQIKMDETNPPEWRRSSCIYLIIANGQTALIETGPAVVARPSLAPSVSSAMTRPGFLISS